MKKSFLFLLLFLSFGTLSAVNVERRAAVDVGSGSTKVLIADVDTDSEAIISIVFEEAFPVPYQAALEASYDGAFDEKICNLGMHTFQEIKTLTENHQVERIAAVATAAFRDASNGERFAMQVHKETGIPLKVITQREEGELAFFSGIAAANWPTEHLIVWDIGTGSFQVTTSSPDNDLTIFMGGVGSIPFRNYIIEMVQGKDSSVVTSPNPMTEENVKGADAYARSVARRAYTLIKEKVKEPETLLIGIGRLFSNSIGPMGENGVIVRSDLRAYIESAVGRTDEELNNPYAHVDVSNAILVLSFMKALHIQEVQIVDTKSTHGILVYPHYWN